MKWIGFGEDVVSDKYCMLPISVAQPGLMLLMVDQSGSMAEPYAGQKKRDIAALTVNRCIYDIVNRCVMGNEYRDRCHIAVIGYGTGVALLAHGGPAQMMECVKRTENITTCESDGEGGTLELDQRLPVWLDPISNGSTPMAEAFNEALDVVQAWVSEYPNNFPPVVINITDGSPDDVPATEAAVARLMSVATTDGETLLFNAHISSTGTELSLPASEAGLPNEFARLLFRMSSVLPPPMLAAARAAGFAPASNARGFIMNANAETLTKLISFGSTHAR